MPCHHLTELHLLRLKIYLKIKRHFQNKSIQLKRNAIKDIFLYLKRRYLKLKDAFHY